MKSLLTKFKNQDSFFAILASSVFLVILAIFSPYFFHMNNFLSLQAIIAPRVIMAIGMMIVVSIGMFDLSVGSTMGLSGVICGYMLSQNYSIILAVIVALGSGIVIGLINGLLVSVGKIIPLIATIGTMYILRGFVEMIMTSQLAMSLTGFPKAFIQFGNGTFMGLYMMVWVMIFLLILFDYLLKRTYIGRQIYYIGGNQKSAISLGFNIKGVTIVCFIISGLLSAVAGIVSVARFQSASRYLGQGMQIDILIACIIGGGSLLGGKGDVKGALFGTLFIALLENAFNLFEINSLFKSVVTGAVLVLVVFFDGYVTLIKNRMYGKA